MLGQCVCHDWFAVSLQIKFQNWTLSPIHTNHSNSMVKLLDGKHNPCYFNFRMRWSETLKLGFQSCIRPWHNSIQAGFPMAVARAPLTIEIQNPWWEEMVVVETLNMRMTNPCSLFLFLYCFSWVHNTYWPTLQNSFLLFFYWVHCTSALFQKEYDTSCSRQCFFFFFSWGGEADIPIFSTWKIWLQNRKKKI